MEYSVGFWIFVHPQDPEKTQAVLRVGGKLSLGLEMVSRSRFRLNWGGEIQTRGVFRVSMWHHVIIVQSGGQLVIFMNGIQDSLKPIGPNSLWRFSLELIGGSFSGYLDDLQVYSRALDVSLTSWNLNFSAEIVDTGFG